MSGIKLKPGWLYVSRCGAVLMHSRDNNNYHVLELVAEGCSQSECKQGETWSYIIGTLLWDGEEENEDFHLHIVREIQP